MKASAALRQAGVSHVLEHPDGGYADAVAGFDLGVECAPEVVVDAQSPADVAAAVAVAAERGEAVNVLGAGHGRLHDIRGGMAITVRHLDAVDVDGSSRLARIGAGCTWQPVLEATAARGLAAPCGSAPDVGVVGYLLGGGIGPLVSSLGFSSDHVRSFDVVTPADGAVTVSAESFADLYWAMRGGKGGFGVITSVVVHLSELSQVYGGGLYFAAEHAPDVLAAYATWAPGLPESATTSVALLRLPPSDALPDAIRGRRVVHVRFASIDGEAVAHGHLAALRAVAEPLLDTVGVLPYGKLGTIHGDPTAPMSVANGTASLHTLDGDAVEAVLGAADLDADLPLSSVEIRTLGPAARGGLPEGDAVGGRDTPHLLNAYAAPTLADDARIEAVRAVLDAVTPWRAPVNLINFVGRANAADAVERSWTAEQNDRLDSVRAAHDPAGLFPYARHGSAPSTHVAPDGRQA